MLIGVKYCGGCNPRYDRVRAVERLAEEFPQHRFAPASQAPEMDLLLVMAGCHVACADVAAFALPKMGSLWMKGKEDMDTVRLTIASIAD